MGQVALVAAAVTAAIVPLSPRFVERAYSAGVYATLQPVLTNLSNLMTISCLDVLIVGVVTLWVVQAVLDFLHRPSRFNAALHVMTRTVVWGAAVYLLFLVIWGLNYRRPRMRDDRPYDATAVTPDAATAAAHLAAKRLNGLHDRAHEAGWPRAGEVDPDLADGFARAVRNVGISRAVLPARPKHTLLDWYFRRAGVDGMTDPFFLETLIATNVLPFERAFVVAHEWSHLAGIADEGEANFTAWLACVSGSSSNAYSGWLFLYGELAGSAKAADRQALSAMLAPGPRADLRAIRERYVRDVNRRVSDAGWRVYDSYLKANRVEAGAASYGEVVRLVLGLRVNGRPILDLSAASQ